MCAFKVFIHYILAQKDYLMFVPGTSKESNAITGWMPTSTPVQMDVMDINTDYTLNQVIMQHNHSLIHYELYGG